MNIFKKNNTQKNRRLFWSSLISFKIFVFLLINILPGRAFLASITSDQIFQLNNTDRLAENIPQLNYSNTLEKSAKYKADDMLKKGYFDHNSPSGTDPWFWFNKVGYDYVFAGENLAIDFVSADEINNSWLKSKTHRDNILNPNFKDIGVGVISGLYKSHITTIVVVHFGTSKSSGQISGASDLKSLTNKFQIGRVGNTLFENILNLIYLFVAALIIFSLVYLFYVKFIKRKAVKLVTFVELGSLLILIIGLVILL
jgi:hypothetical protein